MSKQPITNWGNFPVIEASVRSFKSLEELTKITESASDFIARGNGRCYGDSSLQPNIISTLKYDNILFFNGQEGVITCQSGLMLDSILQFIVPKGWFLPVTPGTKFITVGGAVASDIHGKNHHVDGTFKNHIVEMEVLLHSGKVVLCSPTQEVDLFVATCGGMGLTGIVLNVKFRLKKISSPWIEQVAIKAKNLDEIFDLFQQYSKSTYSVAWIDCLQKGKNLGRSLLLVGEHATQQTGKIEYSKKAQRTWLSIPFYFPGWVLNRWSIKIFNFLFYHKQLLSTKKSIVSFEKFFYPLDFIRDWNKMYGKKGFVQYQFVLPMENSKEGLRKILEQIGKQGTGSFLAVLKLFGENDGMMSFPMKGYTLALDFPIKKGLHEFLDQLDKIVIENGGRIYLTKDARMKKEIFWKSYPRANEFVERIRRINPRFKWKSLQSERLGISSL
jgi:decaprenylphospho-beta-D-ribofuranose 2-oxidase